MFCAAQNPHGQVRNSGVHPILSVFFLTVALAAAVVLTGPGPVCASPVPEADSGMQPSAARQSLDDVPLSARYVISEAIGRDREDYQVRGDDSGFTAKNPNQSYSVSFSDRGLAVKAGSARWEMGLASWGYGADRHPVGPARPQAAGNRVEYRRGALTEWYVNGPYGLQQGFTLASPPAKARPEGEPLLVCLDMRGDLKARVNNDRRSLVLSDTKGSAVFRYGGLKVTDADDRELDAWLEADAAQLFINVDDSQARYPLTIDPVVQSANLTASDGATDDYFGRSVSISGDTIVVGASKGDGLVMNSGSAYVFVKPVGGWSGSFTETAKLIASDGAWADHFGTSVSINGDTIVVGADKDDDLGFWSGSAYVFNKPVDGWSGVLTEAAKLTASDGKANDNFGFSVSVSGDTIVVGAHQGGGGESLPVGPGSAYVFVKPAGGWSGVLTETAKLMASDGVWADIFGSSVSVSGDTIVVGAYSGDGLAVDSGSAYVFVKPEGGWTGGLTETAKLIASDGAIGDYFGGSVSVSGDTIAVGASGVGRNFKGSAYVFVRPANGWTYMTQTARLTAFSGWSEDFFGRSISISGDTVVAGAPGDNTAYVFVKPAGGWAGTLSSKARLWASDRAEGEIGISVSVSGGTVVVGASDDDENGPYSGSAYVFGPNNAPTDIALSNDNVEDQSPVGTAIGQFTTTDSDEGEIYTYTLVSGDGDADNASFTIEGDTLKTAAYVDMAAQDTYHIRVRTDDGRGGAYEKALVIHVVVKMDTLTVQKAGVGTGTVTSVPAGIDCGGDCDQPYVSGASVTLTAAPSGNSVFAGWSGGECSGTGDCVVSLTADTTVTATFDLAPIQHSLTVQKDGAGTGTVTSSPAGIDCGGDCDELFAENAKVTLTATPDTGFALERWTVNSPAGIDCPGNGRCQVTLSQDCLVTATFRPDTDKDGICDDIENQGPNGGDGNNDGTLDSQQVNVATFQDMAAAWTTLVSEPGTVINRVQATGNPSPDDAPAVTFPHGFTGFSITNLTPGASTTLQYIIHSSSQALNTYYKYGPTPDNAASHWYGFTYIGQVGAQIERTGVDTVITLHLTDGATGDDDLAANGVIIDIGAPALAASSGGSGGGGGGSGCFITSLW